MLVECWASSAPRLFKDYMLLTLVVNALTLIPNLFAYWMAKCPSPPIPKTAQVPPILLNLLIGAYTVIPAQSRGGT